MVTKSTNLPASRQGTHDGHDVVIINSQFFLIPAAAKQTEKEQEQVDEIKIKIQCAQDGNFLYI